MDKIEALQAMLEGKKISHRCISGYFYLDSDICIRDSMYNAKCDFQGYPQGGWYIHEKPKKKVKYYRPNVIRNSNGKILKTRDRKFVPSKNAELYSYQDCDILDWEEIEVEE